MNSQDQLLASMEAAIEAGGIPVALIPFQGEAPDQEFYLELLRGMVEATGSATGAITFGAGDASGMIPLTNVEPEMALRLLLQMRQNEVIDPVSWVTVSDDTFRRMVEISPDHKTVREEVDCLMVVCVTPDGPGWLAMQTYTKTPGGVVVWGEVEQSNADVAGDMVGLMNQVVTA